MTDGILLAETQGDRLLSAYECVIIDEAHERSLNIDFLLGYLKQLLPKRPDLKVIITSATIDPQRFARHFGQAKEDGSVLPAPILEVSGRTYPVEVRYEPPEGEADDPDNAADDVGAALVADMPGAVVRAIDGLWRGPNADPTARGDVLVFLPTERDIRDCATALEEAMRSRAEVLPLYARLSIEEQNRVFASGQGKPRIVLATNVAETSVTVPGIRYVVDTGLARLSRYSPKLKVQRLPIERISRASADQRKGRCGRVGPGVCVRLYSEADYESRPVFTDPEILRTNLAEVILQMIALGLGQSADKGSGAIESFPFIDPPDTRQIRDGYQTLFELGAVSDQRHITPIGRELARLPTDPRLGRMILEAEKNGVVDEVLIIAAGLSVQDVRERPMEFAEKADAAHAKFKDETSDFLSILKLWEACHAKTRELSNSKFRKWCKEHFINWTRWREWTEIHRQLRDITAEQLMERRQKDGTRGNRKR
jgi:ATP-dependent helicase HrpA